MRYTGQLRLVHTEVLELVQRIAINGDDSCFMPVDTAAYPC